MYGYGSNFNNEYNTVDFLNDLAQGPLADAVISICLARPACVLFDGFWNNYTAMWTATANSTVSADP